MSFAVVQQFPHTANGAEIEQTVLTLFDDTENAETSLVDEEITVCHGDKVVNGATSAMSCHDQLVAPIVDLIPSGHTVWQAKRGDDELVVCTASCHIAMFEGDMAAVQESELIDSCSKCCASKVAVEVFCRMLVCKNGMFAESEGTSYTQSFEGKSTLCQAESARCQFTQMYLYTISL